eukprot:14230193-Ditylum_brightwellii.AAC.1
MSKNWRQQCLEELEKLLLKLHTEPAIAQTLHMGIKQLLENNMTDAPAQPDLYTAQLSLGFMSLFDRIIHQEWKDINITL